MGDSQKRVLDGYLAGGRSTVDIAKVSGVVQQSVSKYMNSPLFLTYIRVKDSQEDGMVGDTPSLEWIQGEIKKMYDGAKVAGDTVSTQKWFKMLMDFRAKFGEYVDDERMRISRMTNEELAKCTEEAIADLKSLGDRMAWVADGTTVAGVQDRKTPAPVNGDEVPA